MISNNRQQQQSSRCIDFDRLCFWSYYTLLYIIEYQRNVYSQGIKVPSAVETTVNLSTADIKKEGSGYDLPLAIGLLAANSNVDSTRLPRFMMVGEVGLDGRLLPVRGILPIAIRARAEHFEGLIVPYQNVREAAVVNNIDIYGMTTLMDVVNFFNGDTSYKPTVIDTRREFYEQQNQYELDFSDVRGQESVKRALEVAAAGGHNLILLSPRIIVRNFSFN